MRTATHSTVGLRLQPLIKIFLGHDVQITPHVVVPQTTELGADNLIFAHLGRGKVKGEIEPRYKVLLNSQFAHVERVSHVLSVHHQMNLFVHRDDELAGLDVVARRNVVLRIKSEEIRVALINLLGMDYAELPIGSGISEVKRELPGLNLNGQRIRRSGL